MNPGRMSLGMVEAGHYLLENMYLAGNFTILLKIFSLSLPIPQPQLLPPPTTPSSTSSCYTWFLFRSLF